MLQIIINSIVIYFIRTLLLLSEFFMRNHEFNSGSDLSLTLFLSYFISICQISPCPEKPEIIAFEEVALKPFIPKCFRGKFFSKKYLYQSEMPKRILDSILFFIRANWLSRVFRFGEIEILGSLYPTLVFYLSNI